MTAAGDRVLRRGWRPVLLILLLLASAIVSARNVHAEWGDADTAGRRVATGLELAHALAAWLALAGLAAGRRFARPALFVWCVLVAATAFAAATAWGGSGIPAALAGAVAAFLVCFLAIRLGLRPPGAAPVREPA